ncbi:MAG TPA: hypothetical protein VIU42_10020 [Xanthobacteraceae bacterium]
MLFERDDTHGRFSFRFDSKVVAFIVAAGQARWRRAADAAGADRRRCQDIDASISLSLDPRYGQPMEIGQRNAGRTS